MTHRLVLTLVLLALAWGRFSVADAAEDTLRMPAMFGEHMVLQREQPIAVWGWSTPGDDVEVRIASEQASATTDDDGRWQVELPAMSAGGPYTLSVNTNGQTLEFGDVMVGEVWLCSGQSNMDMRLAKVDGAQAAIDHADDRDLRLFYVNRAIANEQRDDVEASWTPSNPSDASRFSAAAYFMGQRLRQELGVAVGLIHTAYGGTPAEAWTGGHTLSANPELKPIVDRWVQRVESYEQAVSEHESAIERGETSKPPTPLTERYAPSGLYNAMLAPIAPYGIRGFIWYQGESNTWRSTQYRELLSSMIADWRTLWGNENLPFAIVQLPNYAEPPRVPRASSSWPELRESQRLAAKQNERVGLIVTIDVGDPTDIHPRDKASVGDRLARWAMAETYGDDRSWSGPQYVDAEFVGDEVIIRFDHAGSGLEGREGQPIRGFVIAGKDKRFRWANAEVRDDTIVVTEAKVTQPEAVRYAWDDNPSWANLINGEGLPAGPFRTDDWPSITETSR